MSYDKTFSIEGGNFQAAGNVSSEIKSILKGLGLPKDTVRRAAIVCYESEINIVSYAKKGKIVLRADDRSVQIEAKDEGPGIPDIELAMKEGYSTATAQVREMGFGAGMGLSNMKRYADDFFISSEVGVGTYVKMVVFNPDLKLHPDHPQLSGSRS
jgi:anti-sigma regulatory factor (Ser/Thr protein kinase)